jgi:hypothetical protein
VKKPNTVVRTNRAAVTHTTHPRSHVIATAQTFGKQIPKRNLREQGRQRSTMLIQMIESLMISASVFVLV